MAARINAAPPAKVTLPAQSTTRPTHFAQAAVRPDGAEESERDTHPEHRAPVDLGQQAAHHETEELSGERGDLVDAQCHPPLFRREGVGKDRSRIRGEHRAADGLHDAPIDQPQRPAAGVEGIERQCDRRDAEDDKPRLYIRTRPNMSPRRPNATTSTAETSR
jgi:hypothetical protein